MGQDFLDRQFIPFQFVHASSRVADPVGVAPGPTIKVKPDPPVKKKPDPDPNTQHLPPIATILVCLIG